MRSTRWSLWAPRPRNAADNLQDLYLLVVIFLAVFVQSAAGFGVALVAMAALPPIIGLTSAAPLVALVALLLEVFLVVYYRQALRIENIWRVIAASLLGVPLGVLFLKNIPERFTLSLLGVVIAGYALYALLRLRLPRLERPMWAYLFGFAAGMLGGAYNTSGPPVIIYGNCRGWAPAEFKGNLQGFFLISSVVVAASHYLGGNFTPQVWRDFVLALPALGIGLAAGLSLDRRIRPETFRSGVLLLLLVLGIRLIFAVL